MGSKIHDKLFFFGKSNGTKADVLKVFLDSSNVNVPSSSAALLINKSNYRDVSINDLKLFDYIVISTGLKKTKITNLIKEKKFILTDNDVSFFESGDLISIEKIGKNRSRIFILYKINSDDNSLVITNNCNSKCIMCPIPMNLPYKKSVNLRSIKKVIKLMDKATKNLGITGGEPTLAKGKLVEVLTYCKEYLPNTNIALLSNGRMFSYRSFVDHINSVRLKGLSFGIPLHSSIPKIHDSITQVSGSFVQTIEGLKNLIDTSQYIELRIVIQKLNFQKLEEISDFIIDNLYGISCVSFMGLEMSGSAIANSSKVWVKIAKIVPYLEKAITKLMTHQIRVNIFNIPPCKLSEPFRNLCVCSISDYKIRYLPECSKCKIKNSCGGVFSSSVNFIKREKTTPIV